MHHHADAHCILKQCVLSGADIATSQQPIAATVLFSMVSVSIRCMLHAMICWLLQQLCALLAVARSRMPDMAHGC